MLQHYTKMMMIYLCFLLLVVMVNANHTEWGYIGANGPSQWKKHYPDCGKKKQSPINLPKEENMMYQNITPFKLEGFDNPKNYSLTFKNNGRSVQLDIDGKVFISEGGLVGKYRVGQLHFHWGKTSTSGSEHTYEGNHTAMEMHIVTWNTKYPSGKDAAKKSDGLAVLSVLIEEGLTASCPFRNLVNLSEAVKYKGDSVNVSYDLVLQDLLPKNMDHFYRYKGSLTTPPCYESVTWTIYASRISLSKAQIANFRNVYRDPKSANAHHLEMNFRSPQPLNGRKVYRNFEGAAKNTEVNPCK